MAAGEATNNDEMQMPCGHCGEKASLQCGQCKNMRYCTIECQEADWQLHKVMCKQYIRIVESGRPADSRLAILLEEDAEVPRYIWLPVDGGPPLNDQDEDDSDILQALADDNEVPVKDKASRTVLPSEDTWIRKALAEKATHMLVCGKQGDGQLLTQSIHVATLEPTSEKGPPSKFLTQHCGKKAGMRYRGELCIFAMTKVYDSSIVVTIDTRGFALALDALNKRVNGGRTPGKKTPAVRVNATKPWFEQIDLPRVHPVFMRGSVSRVADMLGEKLLMLRCKPKGSTMPQQAPATGEPANPAAWLEIESNLKSSGFGSIPTAAKTDTRSMLVACYEPNMLVVLSRPDKEGKPGRLSMQRLKGLIGVIKSDVLSLLNDTSVSVFQRFLDVAKYNAMMHRNLTDNVKKAFDQQAAKMGYDSGNDSDVGDVDAGPKQTASPAEVKADGSQGGQAKAGGKGKKVQAKERKQGSKTEASSVNSGKPTGTEANDRHSDLSGKSYDEIEDSIVYDHLQYYMDKALFLY